MQSLTHALRWNQVWGCFGNPLLTSQAQLGGNSISRYTKHPQIARNIHEPWRISTSHEILVELANNSYGTPYWKITINRSITSMAKKFKSLSPNIYIYIYQNILNHHQSTGFFYCLWVLLAVLVVLVVTGLQEEPGVVHVGRHHFLHSHGRHRKYGQLWKNASKNKGNNKSI
jgi:hypothetical protein